MTLYRCYFLDGNDRIAAPPEIIDAEMVSEAIDKALAMLRERPRHRRVEVWDRAFRLYPPTPPATNTEPEPV